MRAAWQVCINCDSVLPFGEGNLRGHGDLALAPLDGDHTTTQVASFPVHLDALLKELLLETQHTHPTTLVKTSHTHVIFSVFNVQT